MIITLDIHYVYCIYVLIIVVSYIAIDDDDDNDRLLVIEEREKSENRTCTHIHSAYHSQGTYIYIYIGNTDFTRYRHHSQWWGLGDKEGTILMIEHRIDRFRTLWELIAKTSIEYFSCDLYYLYLIENKSSNRRLDREQKFSKILIICGI